MLQLFVGELIFLYPYRKRSYFWVRFPIAAAVCLLVGLFFPTFTMPVLNLYRIIQLIVFFSVTIIAYTVCFDLPFKVTLSLCSAGYALQHIVYQLSTFFHNLPLGDGFTQFVMANHRAVEMLVFIVMYALFYFTLGRHIAREADKYFNNALNFISVFVVLVCILLSLYSGNSNIPIYVSLYSIICCALALILQFAVLNITRLHHENEIIRQKMESDILRYESIKDAIDFINCKCHDLKKELNLVGSGRNSGDLQELKNTIEIYDSVPHTGSVIIDTIMINATLRQTQYGVTFTFSGNGEWLNFVNDADLKSLFLNAISNAADAAACVAPDKRNVSIVLEKHGDMVLVTVRNYYDGAPVASGRLPQTTKRENPDEHGFGLRSMEMVAKKYHGAVTALGTGEIFTLNVFLLDDRPAIAQSKA